MLVHHLDYLVGVYLYHIVRAQVCIFGHALGLAGDR